MVRTGSVERLTLSARVYEELRRSILQGDLPENTELHQVALAEQFGVSIIPVREAIRHLQADGLVETRPFQPAVVRGLSAAEVEEMFVLREELEVIGLRRHAPAMGERDLEALDRLNDRLEAAEGQSDWRTNDWEFHARLVGPDTVTADLVEGLRHRLHGILVADVREARHRDALDEHRRIVACLRDGDVAGAEMHLRQHIGSTADAVRRHLQATAESD